MSFSSVLSRVVLSLVLVFNGASGAAASVHLNHVGIAGVAVGPEREVVRAPEAGPCDEHQQTATVAVEAPAAALQSHAGHPAADCCEGGTCQCACVHHAQAAILEVAFDTTAIAHADSGPAMVLGHVPPTLPHLIRPPIG